MARLEIIGTARITLADTNFKCPWCKQVHSEDDYYKKLYNSPDAITIRCKLCKSYLGVNINMKGDVIVWKEEHPKKKAKKHKK